MVVLGGGMGFNVLKFDFNILNEGGNGFYSFLVSLLVW